MRELENRKPVTSEEWGNHISEFVAKTEFGTPSFFALYDFINLWELYAQINQEHYTHLAQVGGKLDIPPENLASLKLQRIAILENTIEQNKSHVSGYASAYEEIHTSLNYLIGAADLEALAKFPSQEKERTNYPKHIYKRTMADVSSSIYRKSIKGISNESLSIRTP